MDYGTELRRTVIQSGSVRHDNRRALHIDGLDLHIQGVKGEFGYFRILDRDPYGAMVNVHRKDHGYDDLIYGQRINVKSTRSGNRNAGIFVIQESLPKCDFLVGVSVYGRRVRANGFLSVAEFMKMKPDQEYYLDGVGASYRIAGDRLRYIFELPNACWMRKQLKDGGWKMPFPKTEEELNSAGYQFTGQSICRGCGALMEWWITPSGKKMPLDPVTREPHHATCPKADGFRRKRNSK